MFFPTLTGNAETYNIKRIANADPMNFNGAIGFLPLLFGLWGCVMLWKRKEIRPFVIIAVLGLLIPIATPLYNYLYHRFFIVSSFSFCIIGAVSFQLYVKDAKLRHSFVNFLGWTEAVLGVIISLLIAGWIYIAMYYNSLMSNLFNYLSQRIQDSAFAGNQSWMVGRVEKTLHYYSSLSPVLWLPILSAAFIVIALSYYQKDRISSRNVIGVVLFMTVIELFVFTRSWLPSIDSHEYPIHPPNPISTYLQHDTSGSRFMIWRDVSKEPFILSTNGSNIYKTNDISGYESMTNRSMIVFYLRNRGVDTLDLRLLGLANVKYIITGKREFASPDLRRLYSADSVTIYENLLCKPRAYFAYRGKVAESDSAAATELLRQDFDGSEALFTKDDAPPDLGMSSQGENSIHFDRSENEEVAITAQTESKGIFILTDTYYPGWKCYVNGKETPIYRVNNCMRGIILDGGTSKIVFRFEPNVFRYGMWISLLALMFCIGRISVLKKNTKR
jgi:hypothetical protein